MPTLIKKYEEEDIFACILLNGSGLFHGTSWPLSRRELHSSRGEIVQQHFRVKLEHLA